MAATGFVTATAVTSVNDETGAVDLDAADVGAETGGAVAAHAAATGAHSITGVAGLQAALDGKAGTPGAWADITPAANVAHWATSSAQARTVHGGTSAELSGRLELTGAVASGTAWGVIPEGCRPAYEVKIPGRSASTGATGNTITIGTDGVISFGASLNAGAELLLDNITYRRA